MQALHDFFLVIHTLEYINLHAGHRICYYEQSWQNTTSLARADCFVQQATPFPSPFGEPKRLSRQAPLTSPDAGQLPLAFNGAIQTADHSPAPPLGIWTRA